MEDSFCETLQIQEAGGIQTCYLRVEKLVSEPGYQVCAEGQKRSRCNGGGPQKSSNYQICAARFATLAEAKNFMDGVAQDCFEELGFFRPPVTQESQSAIGRANSLDAALPGRGMAREEAVLEKRRCFRKGRSLFRPGQAGDGDFRV